MRTTDMAIILTLWGAAAWAQTDFDPKYERDYNIFNPADRYQPNNPLNPANAYDPNSAFNPANRYDPGNPVNPSNRYSPDNPFNPANRYHPDNPLNPANRYNPNVPLGRWMGGAEGKRHGNAQQLIYRTHPHNAESLDDGQSSDEPLGQNIQSR